MSERSARSSPSPDSLGLDMSSKAASSMPRSPTDLGGNNCQGADAVSPDTSKSGWKGKREEVNVNSPKSKNTSVKRSETSLCDPDEIIEIDDKDSPQVRVLRSLRSASVLTDSSKLCEFPMGTKDSVSVCLADYKTLEHETFLNDIIIDFYLTYLFYNILREEDRSKVHIFSTMFYKRMNSTPKKTSTVASYETDSTIMPAEKRHLRVKGWTKNVNLFEKNMVIIPICEHSHWYLIIAIRPGLISLPVGSEERVKKGEPFLIVLDSMGGSKTDAVSIIRDYLAAEWKTKMFGKEQFKFSSKEIRTVRPKKPEQENYTDCGIYLLKYIEKMFESVAQYYRPGHIIDLSTWFTSQEVSTKRDEIARLIRELSEDQNPYKIMKFPYIPFLSNAPSTRSKNRKKEYEHLSSETEEVDSNAVGKAVGSTGLDAAGFYGERSGQPRYICKTSSSRSLVTSGESDGSSVPTTMRDRERYKKREFRTKEKVEGSTIKEESGLDVGAKSVTTSTSSADSDISRQKLKSKMKQIKSANEIFDEVRKSITPKISKLAKDNDRVDGAENAANKVRKLLNESSIGRDNMQASSKPANFSATPTFRPSKKVENKNISAALKAFHEHQKAIRESLVKVTGCPDLDGFKQSSISPTITDIKKSYSFLEKGKVLQRKVLEDDVESGEETNTEDEDEDGDIEVVNQVKVLRIADEMETEDNSRKVDFPDANESFRNTVTEKGNIKRYGKGLSKLTTKPENICQSENNKESKYDFGGPTYSPSVLTWNDTPETSSVEDTLDTSIRRRSVDESRDFSSEVATIEETASDLVVPREGLLEEVLLGHSSTSIEEIVVSRKSTKASNIFAARKSTLESEAQTSKVRVTSDVDAAHMVIKSSSEPDSPHYVSTASSRELNEGRHKGLPKLNRISSGVVPERYIPGPNSPVAFLKSNGIQDEPIMTEANPDTSVKSSQESHSSIIDLKAIATLEFQTSVNLDVNSSSLSSSRFKSPKLKSTLKPGSRIPLEVMSPSKPHSSVTKSTSEPRSPKVALVKTTSEPVSPIISKRKLYSNFRMNKNVKLPKIVVDSDSEDGWNSPNLSLRNPVLNPTFTPDHLPDYAVDTTTDSLTQEQPQQRRPVRERWILNKNPSQLPTNNYGNIKYCEARIQLLRENPFYESFTASRGTKSTHLQRGRPARNNSACNSHSWDIDTADQLHTDTARHEVSIKMDLQENNDNATTTKRFRLQSQGKLCLNAFKHQACKNIVKSLRQYDDQRLASDSGRDTTYIANN